MYKSAFIATLITLVTFFNNALSNDLIENLDERLIRAMGIEAADILPIEFHAKSKVSDNELQRTMSCVHESVPTYLTPLYVEELNKLFTSNEKIKALRFFESSAWKKSWEIQTNYFSKIFGKEVNGAAVTISLLPSEEQEIKQFASSDLGERVFAFAMSQDQNDGRTIQMDKIKDKCIDALSITMRARGTAEKRGSPSTLR